MCISGDLTKYGPHMQWDSVQLVKERGMHAEMERSPKSIR